MTRVVFAVAALTVSFAAKLFINKMLEAQLTKAIDQKLAEQNAPTN